MHARHRFSLRLVALALLLGLLCQSGPQAASAAAGGPARTLSALGPTDGTVRSAAIAGSYVVYLAEYDVESRLDLYSAPLAGGAPTRLSADLPAGDVESFKLAGSSVVFSKRDDSKGQNFLYSVPAAGGAPTQLSLSYPTSNSIPKPGNATIKFAVSPDGARVVFSHDQAVGGFIELFSAPVAGPAVRISQSLLGLSPGPQVRLPSFVISPDSQSVVYVFDRGDAGIPASLYRVPIGGGGFTELMSADYRDPVGPQYTPDGARVIYTASPAAGQLSRLVSVLSNGTGTVELAQDDLISFRTGGAGGRVVFASTSFAGNTTALKSALAAGGAVTPLVAAIGVSSQTIFVLDPSGATVFYNPNGAPGLSRVPAAGGAVVPVFSAGEVALDDLDFSADGLRALFPGGAVAAKRLYSYALSGGPATRIDDPAVTAGGVRELLVPDAGDRALYSAKASAGAATALYSLPVAGGASLKLSGTPAAGESDLRPFAASGSVVIFAAGSGASGLIGPNYRRLLRAPIAGGSAAAVDTSRAIVGDVNEFAVSPVDARAVYLADQETDNVFELYSVPVGGGATVRLNSAGQQVQSFLVSPVGGRVVYAATGPGAAGLALYSVPIKGGAPAAVGAALAVGQTLQSYALTPDGARVFYLVDTTLNRAPAAGGAAAVAAQEVARFTIDPTGARVVYVAGASSQVSSVPVAGGAVATLGSTGVGGTLLISPDGKRVVFSASQGIFPSPDGLLSAPIGGGASVVLTKSEVGGGLAGAAAQISADSAYLIVGGTVSIVNLNDPIVQRIQRVPIAGGAAVTLAELSSPADSTLPTLRFRQAPGGGPVVYGITRNVVNVGPVNHALASVPLAGGAKTTLYGPTTLSSTAFDFTLSDDGKVALLQAGGDLYRVATGGGTPLKLNPVADATPVGFSDAGKIVFRAGREIYVARANGAGVTSLGVNPDGDKLLGAVKLSGEAAVFLATRDIPQLAPGVTELQAVDLSFRVALPMIRR